MFRTSRARKVSRFVVEALDLSSPAPVPRKSSPLEALARHQAPARVERTLAVLPDSEPLRLSFGQVDDYRTCPLKYRYVHVLRVPLLAHHRIVYGAAMHKALQAHFKARLDGRDFSADDLAGAFRAAWVSEGFLSREHEEERLRVGEEGAAAFPRAGRRRPARAHGGGGGIPLLGRQESRRRALRPGRRAARPRFDRRLQDR